MIHVVVAGSASLPEANEKWVEYWNRQDGCVVTNYPKPIPEERFREEYPSVHKEYFQSLKEADVLFVANEEKRGIPGYIGAEVFAEIVFAIALNLVDGKNVKVILANMPSDKVQSYEEIQLWLDLGWVTIHQPSENYISHSVRS
jgi:hypothetical protein